MKPSTNGSLVGIPSNGRFMRNVAQVFVPPDIERESYIADCIKNCRVAIRSTYSGAIIDSRATVPRYLIGHIKFPTEGSNDGSLVFYNKTEKRLLSVILAVIPGVDSGGNTNSPHHHRLESETEEGKSEISLNSNRATLKSDGDNSTTRIVSIGKSGLVEVIAASKFITQVLRRADKSYAKFSFEDEKWQLLKNGDGSKSESGVLGDTLLKKLEKICDEIDSIATSASQLTVASPFGPLGPPINLQSFVDSATSIKKIKSELSELLSENYIVD